MTKQKKGVNSEEEEKVSPPVVSLARYCRTRQHGFVSELDYEYDPFESSGSVQGADTGVPSVQEDCDKKLPLNV